MTKTDYSLECERCGNYNLQDGIIEKGNIYCIGCHDEIMEKRRKWRLYKKFNVLKVPIKFKKKSGEVVTIYGRKLVKKTQK